MQWEEWLNTMHRMSKNGGKQGEKQRLKGEIMTWEVWKERCHAIHAMIVRNQSL